MNFLSQAIVSNPEPDWSRLQALPICETDDPLVPLGLVPSPLRVYPAYFHLGVPGALAECYVRRPVLTRLQQASRLLPAGVELVVLDGWRPLAVQQYLFDTLTGALREHYPAADQAELLARARRFVAPPSADPAAPSPHLTGGSVDVALCDSEGRLLDMGTEFDDISPWSYSAAFEAVVKPGAREADIIENRRLLHSVMGRAGFTNLPSEWWHFDYGNQSWAWFSQAPQARFGPVFLSGLGSRWAHQVGLFNL
ncbi:D-alanyl-D-alanine dipeptidase [Zobellella endophytica]|uniref:D-alanyl-D-alanine dipeptidase n=1 Tax=Zobellella endophytica TaxID=2116700 RepID=A0A2P7R3H7_9GAMM|nr:M15 family metallopeptidase [Zobellella endophytica]PSJ44746.1 D-alanyl-D-alanine dipeptidase [Zobellella endophytica]